MVILAYLAEDYCIRHDFGNSRQAINCKQKELADYWSNIENPCEIIRLYTQLSARFYGYCRNGILIGKEYRECSRG